MSTYDLQAERESAGRHYEASARQYVEAWVKLRGLDYAAGEAGGFGSQPVICGHSQFLPDPAAITADPAGRALAHNEHVGRQIRRSGG